ncbi:MAG: tRNA (adenosine(37)-N6)-threonylcarbamoyltransferase complex dimerization subunit type 1 TsaB [Gammaproteobacteria bacterium]|nr:tRNA (adenosine(37)-N6)-threonylcarbamoyltransferase complex dimerization subunit type 1 TsaB [Gammaproteobacteria bacterium]
MALESKIFMKILAIDTSSNACSVALLDNEDIESLHKIAPIAQAQLVLPMVQELMQEAKIQLQHLDAIAFGCGPGSFTGLRIAASVAQGLAFAAEVPLIKISSLASIAQHVFQERNWNKLLVAVDARMQEIYYGAYEINSEGFAELKGEEKVCSANQIPLHKNQDWYGVGDAWGIYSEIMELHLGFKPLDLDITCLPHAASIALLARNKLLKKEFCSFEDAVPVYLRNNVAVKEKDR